MLRLTINQPDMIAMRSVELLTATRCPYELSWKGCESWLTNKTKLKFNLCRSLLVCL